MNGLTFTASVFWLLPVVLALLLWIRFLRGRRREVVAGSLLIWKKLATQQPATPPRRFVFDRSLLLQALALVALVCALARPEFDATHGGRTVVLVIDNGPLSRFRGTDGTPLWENVRTRAATALDRLERGDAVILVRAAPFPALVTPEPVKVAEAQALLKNIGPALSGADRETLFAFARNVQRTANASGLAVVSAAAAPEVAASGSEWISTNAMARPNVGIVAFGANASSGAARESIQCMVRVHNGGDRARTVPLRVTQGTTQLAAEMREIPAGGDTVLWVDGVDGARPVTFSLDADDGLPDDNSVTAEPVRSERFRVRFHAALPALQRLFDTATGAEILAGEAAGSADLEVYAGTPPQELPPSARAALLVEPTAGYRYFFEIGEARLNAPVPLRDEASPLTENFKGGESDGAGLFPLPSACEVLRTGAFTSLLKDSRSQRTLAARFVDEKGRPGYVLAFTPGGGQPAEALLPPELVTLLIRMLREAAGRAAPFQVLPAAQWEATHGTSAPASTPVLDESVTALQAEPHAASAAADWLQQGPARHRISLRPWLIAAALLLLAAELMLSRSAIQAQPAQAA